MMTLYWHGEVRISVYEPDSDGLFSKRERATMRRAALGGPQSAVDIEAYHSAMATLDALSGVE